MLKITDLRIENEKNPSLVSAAVPRFGWKPESDLRSVFQAACRLQVAPDPDFHAPVWDSGRIESGRSQYVPYAGTPLLPGTRYYVRVRAWSRTGEDSGWSAAERFETAPAGPWSAPFVTVETGADAASSRSTLLRKEFTLAGTPARALVYATALGLYELYVNGTRVGDAAFTPGWTNYRKRLQYQAWDVTGLLRAGDNVVGAELGAGWFKGHFTWFRARNFYGKHTAFSMELRITDGTGNETLVTTGDSPWKGTSGPILYSEIYHGETYDARAEKAGWAAPGFDDSPWKTAHAVPFDASVVVPQDGPLVMSRERLKPVAMLRTPKGKRVLDFGQNLTGRVRFTVSGNAGDRVILRHAEILDAKGNFYVKNLRKAKQRVEYVLKGGGTETYEPHFSFQGFRYVSLDEYPGTPDPASFEAVIVHSAMEPALEFECSNELLNRLHHNILWGWKGNALDIPTDCPQRDERLGWTGDAQVFIGTAAMIMDVYPFFRKWLRDLASEQREDGGVPYVVPDLLTALVGKDRNIRGTHSSTGWGDAAVICPWTIYERYGDERLLAEHYPSMKAWVEYIRKQAGDACLWNTGFHFGDWVALDAKEGSYFGATPNDLIATAFYAYSTELLAKAARALGREDEAEDCEALHGRIVRAFRDEFYTPGGRLASRTQTAHILALVFNLVPDGHRERAVNDLVALIKENGGHLTTGFLGTPYICRALSENGRLDAAFDLLLKEDFPSWLYLVKMGATTVWEHWDGMRPDGKMWSWKMNSFNHYAYGAVGEWMYETVGGIVPDPGSPGFGSFRIAPRPGGGITRCRTTCRSLHGLIRSDWRIENGTFILEAEIPVNTTAAIVLEGIDAASVTPDAGLAFRNVGGGAVAETGSGIYLIRAAL